MSKQIRIVVEYTEDDQICNREIITEKKVKEISSISELGFCHKEQIDILQSCQDELLKAQSYSLKEKISSCPRCGVKLKLAGTIKSHFYSVFTDHKVSVRRQKCCNPDCGWTSVPSISSLFNTNVHPDLAKLQVETACNHTYRESQDLMDSHSYYQRKVNNHEHIYRTVETVGNYISKHQIENIPDDVQPADELICQIDGGHLKTKEEGKRSFEALTAVIYKPGNVIYPAKKNTENEEPPRGVIVSKHCSASALEDEGVTIKRQTKVAALKQGLTADTKITALCDGASNCWNVVDALEEECQSVDRILDWFHIAKKFKNISLPKYLDKKLERVKWCLWHGRSNDALGRFDGIIEKTRKAKMKERLIDLKIYLNNNKPNLVNYASRYKDGKLISSSLAESNVESLINKRCKGKQHMRWSREGVHPLLQIRAARASNDWFDYGRTYVLNATTQKAA